MTKHPPARPAYTHRTPQHTSRLATRLWRCRLITEALCTFIELCDTCKSLRVQPVAEYRSSSQGHQSGWLSQPSALLNMNVQLQRYTAVTRDSAQPLLLPSSRLLPMQQGSHQGCAHLHRLQPLHAKTYCAGRRWQSGRPSRAQARTGTW